MHTSKWISIILFVFAAAACTGDGAPLDGGTSGGGGCSTSADCLDGEVCANGECSIPLCSGSACDDSCLLRADCPAGQICRDGDCMDPDGACGSNEECLDGFVCDGILDTCVELNPPEDAGMQTLADAGLDDAGASMMDGGPIDGGVEDAGNPSDGGGNIDGGQVADAGVIQDAGVLDAGQPQPDAGQNPAEVLCSSLDHPNGKATYLALDSDTKTVAMAGQGNNYEQSCNSDPLPGVGEEVIFQKYFDTNETIHFSASVDTNADLLVYITDDCMNPVCLDGFDDAAGGGTETGSYTNTGLFRAFYIIIDEWAVSAGGLDYGDITFQYCLTTATSSCL